MQVVDGDERQPPRPRERLGGGDADEQRTDQSGPHRDGNRVDLRVTERLPDHGSDQLKMSPARHLGDHASKLGMKVAWDATTLDAISPSAVTSAAAVSSQLVSMPRITL